MWDRVTHDDKWPRMTAPGSCRWPFGTPPSLSHCFLRSRGSRHCCPRMLAGAGPSGPHTSRALGAGPGRSGTGERGIQIRGEARLQQERWEGSLWVGDGLWTPESEYAGTAKSSQDASPAGFPSLASLLHPQNRACSSRPEQWFSKCGSQTNSISMTRGWELEMQILRLCWWVGLSHLCSHSPLGDPVAPHICVPLSEALRGQSNSSAMCVVGSSVCVGSEVARSLKAGTVSYLGNCISPLTPLDGALYRWTQRESGVASPAASGRSPGGHS